MEFSVHAPPVPLADAIKTIWLARGTRTEFDTPDPIVPDGCVEIVFNLGDRFVNAETGEPQPRALLAGQMTGPVTALPTGSVDLIGVRFHTGRAGAALRMPMWRLQNQLIAASDVVRRSAATADDLANMPSDRRLTFLYQELARWLGPVDRHALAQVDHALQLIAESRGRRAIDDVASDVGKTRRHVERQFREHVGLSAKQLSRITRIHAVLEMLRRHPEMSGAEIAAAAAYSDQAHLIRECRQLTGQTPTTLRTTQRSLSGLMR